MMRAFFDCPKGGLVTGFTVHASFSIICIELSVFDIDQNVFMCGVIFVWF